MMMRNVSGRSPRGLPPRGTGRILPFFVMAIALAACSGDERPSSAGSGRGQWVAVFAAPTDTLFLDTASILRVREGVYRARFRSTRNPRLAHEETDCTGRRTRSIGTSDTTPGSPVVVAGGEWEPVPPGSRQDAYVRSLCEIAPRRTP